MSRELALWEYLNSEFQLTGSESIDIAWKVWKKLKKYLYTIGYRLEAPDACSGTKNSFMYTWSKNGHYLECEIKLKISEEFKIDPDSLAPNPSYVIEFFYRNRMRDEIWGEDTTLNVEFSPAILEKAKLFALLF